MLAKYFFLGLFLLPPIQAVIPDGLTNPQSIDHRIDKLFKQESHRQTKERRQTINWWVNIEFTNKRPNPFDLRTVASSDQINARMSFLEHYWQHKFFRPFDTIGSSANTLLATPGSHFIMRLSTTKPGVITVSYKKGSYVIKHTRYRIEGDKLISDEGTTSYQSFEDLAKYFERNICTESPDSGPLQYIQ